MKLNKNQTIVVIGSGMAAYMLAQSIRQEDKEISIIIVTERDGRFYPKPMLSTALYHKKTPESILTATSKSMAEKYQIEVITNEKVLDIRVEDKAIELKNRVLHYDKLILATGSRSNIIPNLQPVDGYMSVNSMEDYEQLLKHLHSKKRILIVGSGLVGVEFAHDLLDAGHEVSMVSQDQAALWPLIPREVGVICRDHLIKMGLNWFVDQGVRAVERIKNGVRVIFTEYPEKSYDIVLSAIGISPRVDLAIAANLKVNKGIVTDAFGRTSNKHVFALGDCAEIHGLVMTYVAPIKQQAHAIAKSLLGTLTKIDYPAMPVVVKMPTLPLTLVPVRQVNPEGEWQMVQNDSEKGLIAAYYHPDGRLQGFVLAGSATRQRNDWLKKMPTSILS